jgi:lipid-A-disaccharide synthase
MKKNGLDVFISCGESSGDVVAADLLRPLQIVIAKTRWAGVIGHELELLGIRPLRSLEGLQVMGFTAVLKSFPLLKQHTDWMLSRILALTPKVVLLVDYPGFHLRLAKKLREKGFEGKIIQYVCPSVWAWKKQRIKSLANYFDEVWGILPFESQALKESGVRYFYTGNPAYRLAACHRLEFGQLTRETIGLFPGSRPQEIRSHLPLMIEAAEAYERKYPGQEWLLSVASDEALRWIEPLIQASALHFTLIKPEERWQQMHRMKAAIAVSGTVCLELVLHRVPTVALYACGYINYMLAKYLFRLKLHYFTLPNLILNRGAFPELIAASLSPSSVLKELEHLFDPLKMSQLQQAISELEAKLCPKSSANETVLEHLLKWTDSPSSAKLSPRPGVDA